MMIVGDTSAVHAAFDDQVSEHPLAVKVMEEEVLVAVGVILADRYQTNQMFTLDQRAFRAISPLTAKFNSFRILPADL